MPRKTSDARKTPAAVLAGSPELQQAARQMAALALAQMEQEGRMNVRQREQLRRALATAGDAFGWAGITAGDGDSIPQFSKQVLAMAKYGTKAMAKDLEEETARKRKEVDQLGETVELLRKIAGDAKTEYPVEVVYCYTVRDAYPGFVTKIDTLTLDDAKGAQASSDSIEKGIPSRTKLTDLMIVDLVARKGKLEAMAKTLSDFVKGCHGLMREVIVTLQ